MTTTTKITDKQISLLRDEAGAHGDLAQVAVCDAALDGDPVARAKCVEMIEYAAAEAKEVR